MQAVWLISAHFLQTALSRITDFIINNRFKALLERRLLCLNIFSKKAVVLSERVRNNIAQKLQRGFKQRCVCGYELVINNVHSELYDL
ncbi:hypothetical protein D3C78_902970 [compost metagenome]